MAESNFVSYQIGQKKLLDALGKEHPKYNDVWALGIRLVENIENSRSGGETPQLSSDRSGILAQLNRHSLELFDKNFDEFYEVEKIVKIIQEEIVDKEHEFIRAEAPNINETKNLSTGILNIFSIIERMCYNGDIKPEEGQILKELFTGVAMKKEKGEEPMSPQPSNNPGEMFSYSSQALAYDLITLSDYHKQWPNISIHNNTKTNSLALLKKIQEQILKSSALIDQIVKTKRYSRQAERIVVALKALRQQFLSLDTHLVSGGIPYEKADEIERHFDDLVYYLNGYILALDELSHSTGDREWVQ